MFKSYGIHAIALDKLDIVLLSASPYAKFIGAL